jgi:aminopeptidase N
MQPTDARKTFPCFDEPGVKATYDVTLIRKSNMTSLANMNRIRTEPRYAVKKFVDYLFVD